MSILTRQKLSEELHKLCENVYYNSPSFMKYPCFKYELSDINSKYSNDEKYISNKSYKITYITSNPGSDADNIIEEVRKFRYCNFNTHFTNDSMHHYVFQIILEN